MASFSSFHRDAEVGKLTASAAKGDVGESAVEGGRAGRDTAGDDTELEPRRSGRVQIGVPAQAACEGADLVGVLKDISTDGAMLVVPGPTAPSNGSGLEVAFRLPTGPQLRLSANVRWSRSDDPTGYSSCGMQFLNVSGPNRSYLQHFVELAASTATEGTVRAEVLSKYRLSFDAAGRAQVMLGGMLTRDEAQSLCALVKQRMSSRKNAPAHFTVDVRRLSVCNQEVVLELRHCFEIFAQRADVFGLLVGHKSLALTQLVRAAREAGIADNVFCVNTPEEAIQICEQMEGVTR